MVAKIPVSRAFVQDNCIFYVDSSVFTFKAFALQEKNLYIKKIKKPMHEFKEDDEQPFHSYTLGAVVSCCFESTLIIWKNKSHFWTCLQMTAEEHKQFIQ